MNIQNYCKIGFKRGWIIQRGRDFVSHLKNQFEPWFSKKAKTKYNKF